MLKLRFVAVTRRVKQVMLTSAQQYVSFYQVRYYYVTNCLQWLSMNEDMLKIVSNIGSNVLI